MIVIADASPIRYLVLIDEIAILEQLYGQVLLPATVAYELTRAQTPAKVRDWVMNRPDWATVAEAPATATLPFAASEWRLHAGEYEAFQIASTAGQPTLLLIDDSAGRKAARKLGISFVGTIGILALADEAKLLNFAESIGKLRTTNFRFAEDVVKRLGRS